ncbi:Spy/CpxP family protein refolding chaperone [Chromobacterium piscinae]|uniref:Spy/CpxP family protein refolding chaperone n=1 Tax=Chromobacterium piscinae TaxID=686831 RepID=UPI001407DFAC|nr:Spy/CpxP family protein refolding chaperone [Chromobacterium piscinae]MBX9295903.1 Spy/CpxP family protein refolding chaperone [Chromobacterium vaccinii]MBX9356714.1 Spy/CpxP family protein refolding chaperone [Chromobacterium vaccinii]MCD4502740.1 Spy/CpxP family protein refolding chaperone [Chromobacterium piscinae]NHQ80887.1 Spy/CpxP family protein refolding chaperone [Chromobacterium vaccinii]
MTQLLKPLLVAGLLFAGSAAAYADDAPAPASAHKGWHMDPAKREEMRAKHLQALHDKLKIQPQQEAAWQTFTASMKPEKMEKPPMDANATAPEKMESMMQRQQARMQQRLDALKAFYAQLTPEQQKTMDNLHGPRGKWQHHKKPEGAAPANG